MFLFCFLNTNNYKFVHELIQKVVLYFPKQFLNQFKLKLAAIKVIMS